MFELNCSIQKNMVTDRFIEQHDILIQENRVQLEN